MEQSDLQRLIKIENRIMEIANEDLKLDTVPIEFDIVPSQKMLEMMAYRIPTNVSSWKFGRDYERIRTIYEHLNDGLPYEVVINSDPIRAYLMRTNTFAVQVLVMAHVVGHVAFFTMNKHYSNTRRDIVEYMMEASKRINIYERRYGIDEVEAIIDAGHSLQFHSSPFDLETEEEKRERIFKQEKQGIHIPKLSEYGDISDVGRVKKDINMDIELFNQKLWRNLNLKTPVEPTEDILRYVIDNSRILEDWHKDILEVLRTEGQHHWPTIKTRYMNEGFATYIHEYIMDKLFKEDLLTASDHAQYNYSNALVKAQHVKSMNPYHVGSKMWEDIVDRWDKGKYGREWENCDNIAQKEEWDTKEMNGYKKMIEVMRTYTDWFFMQDFLTTNLVRDLDLYIYAIVETPVSHDFVVTKHQAEEIRKLIINSFAHSGIPRVEVVNGNHENKGNIKLEHRWSGADLDRKYTEETLKHIFRLWGRPVHLTTKVGGNDVSYIIKSGKFHAPTPKSPPKPGQKGIPIHPFGTLVENPLEINNHIVMDGGES